MTKTKAITIGYLGPAGSQSHQALLKLLNSPQGSFLKDADLVSLENFQKQMEAIASGEVPLSIFPIENSLEGSVLEVMESMGQQLFPLQPLCEFLVQVQHSLIHPKDIPLEEIERVVSHPLALAQCSRSIHRLLGEHVKVVPMVSTSEAVRSLNVPGNERTAAIGTIEAANLYGMTVLRADMSDATKNITRFLLVGNPEHLPQLQFGGHHIKKTSMCMGIKDRPGGLVDLLSIFKDYRINMTRIESRPSRKRFGDYLFYVDLEIDLTDSEQQAIMRFLQGGTTFLHVLKPYPSLGLINSDEAITPVPCECP